MELKDTVEGMCSDDYIERFRAEHAQLAVRAMKLDKMLEDWDAGKLGFEPKCSRELLMAQLAAMASYSLILEERARVEGIELGDGGWS